ncbi:YciI family protein [soil metagenome]
MRFMIIVKSQPDFEAETTPQSPDEQLMKDMADFHEEMVKAGVLLDASGLQPSRKGWRIHYEGGKRTVVDGPFAEARELIAGFTIIQVRSREEAMEWSRRFPNPAGQGKEAVIEVRQLYELEDFEPNAQVERFRAMDMPSQG